MATEQDIKDRTKRRLGLGIVAVELTDDHLSDCLVRAKYAYRTYFGQGKQVSVEVAADYAQVEVPDDCEAVVDVAFPDSGVAAVGSVSDLRDFDVFAFRASSVGGSSSLLTDLFLFQSHREQLDAALSDDNVWAYYEETRTLILKGHAAGTVIYWYVGEVDVERLVSSHVLWIEEWTYAEACEILAMARGKYSTLPSATGDVSLNADTLMSKANELRDKLTERATSMQNGHFIITG